MSTVMILLGAMAVAPLDVVVTPIRGEQVTGQLVNVTSQQIVVASGDGELVLKSEELLQAQRGLTAPMPRSEDLAPVVTLTDGSVLHATSYSVAGGRAQLTLMDGAELTVSTRAIDHVRLMRQSAATADQWQELVTSPRKSDLVVIRKKADVAGDDDKIIAKIALDSAEGVLADIDDASVGLEFDNEQVNVSRGNVQGVIYYHRSTTTPRDPICRVVDLSGSSWNARSLNLEDGSLAGICVSGVRFNLKLEQVATLDYSVGNIDYLSDLPPESVIWKPRRIAGNPPSAQRWFSPKFDTGLYGSVLKLDDVPYEKGLALHSHAEVSYRLTKRYRTFSARVGVDDGFRYEANLELRIYGDNDVIFSRKITGRDEPFDLELDMQGVRRLKIVVGFGEDDSDRGDNLNLCNARLTK